MNTPLLKQLIGSGLSDKEAKIYLSLLELELATVFEVAEHSGINRSSAYVVLEALKKKGLAGISDDKNVRRYVAASPEILLQTVKTAAKKQEDIKAKVESILPELKALHKATKRRPIVKIFEGKDGAREVYWSLLETKTKELRVFANPAEIFKHVPDFQTQDSERAKKGIKMFAISPATKEMLELVKYVKPNKPYEQVLIPKDKYNFSSDMGIFGDKIAIVSPKDNFGIIIESQEIADMLKNSFDLAWEEAKRLDKKIKR
ncbi:MAG: helix-turn-helix domain-containing protein [Candidatus Doudnabacteria bacterium]